MRAGLDASTVTPGRTAPEVSRTIPAIAAVSETCAHAAAGRNRRYATTTGRTSRWKFMDSTPLRPGRRIPNLIYEGRPCLITAVDKRQEYFLALFSSCGFKILAAGR